MGSYAFAYDWWLMQRWLVYSLCNSQNPAAWTGMYLLYAPQLVPGAVERLGGSAQGEHPFSGQNETCVALLCPNLSADE